MKGIAVKPVIMSLEFRPATSPIHCKPHFPLDRPYGFELPICIVEQQSDIDNTKPLARVGRKAYRVSKRQPGRRNIIRYSAPAFFMGTFCRAKSGKSQQRPIAVIKWRWI
jgi:hypothetical protein